MGFDYVGHAVHSGTIRYIITVIVNSSLYCFAADVDVDGSSWKENI